MFWSADEMNYFGFGITKKGTMFTVPYTDLGDFNKGTKKQFNPLKKIFEVDLPNDSLEIEFVLWLIENDSAELFKTNFSAWESRVKNRVNGELNRLITARGDHYDRMYLDAYKNMIQTMNTEAKNYAIDPLGQALGDEVLTGVYLPFTYTGKFGANNSLENILTNYNDAKITGFGGKYIAKLEWNFIPEHPYQPITVPPHHR